MLAHEQAQGKRLPPPLSDFLKKGYGSAASRRRIPPHPMPKGFGNPLEPEEAQAAAAGSCGGRGGGGLGGGGGRAAGGRLDGAAGADRVLGVGGGQQAVGGGGGGDVRLAAELGLLAAVLAQVLGGDAGGLEGGAEGADDAEVDVLRDGLACGLKNGMASAGWGQRGRLGRLGAPGREERRLMTPEPTAARRRKLKDNPLSTPPPQVISHPNPPGKR